jgi:thiol-disulfide isomerase/thioredoxin
MNIDILNNKIKTTPALMIYFSGIHCGVCQVLHPKMQKAFNDNYPKIEQLEIKTEENIELAREFNVFAMPTILVYFDGKEINRKARNLSVEQLIQEIKRPYSLFF